MRTEMITLADQAGRRRIKKDIEKNLIVEAGAGSGKTTEMSNRIVALLESGHRKIGEIAAITFTKKAANELQHRVHSRLEFVYAETGNEVIRDALENYNECFIGTIHSFCGKLLRERPIEAGVDPGFEEIDDATDLAIRDKIWEDYVFLADDEGEELLDTLNVLNIKVTALKNFLKIVCDNQDVEFDHGYDNTVDMDSIDSEVNRVFGLLCEFMSMAKQDLPDSINLSSDNLDKMQISILMFLKKTKNRNEISIDEKIRILSRYTTKSCSGVTQKRWSNDNEVKKRAKEIGTEMGELRDTDILPLFETIKSFAYNKVFLPYVKRSKTYYVQYKKQTGKMNFQDLLILTNNMLRDSADVRMHFQDKYKTLLVDEFQDTDPIQTQIVMYLTGREIEEKRWDKLTPYPGSLFVVGDPKQSIYAFRRADIEIYEKFKQHVVNSGGALVELTTNFRASKELGVWYNTTFSEIFNQTDNGNESGEIQATFSDLHVINSSEPNTVNGVYIDIISERKKDEIQYYEFKAIQDLVNDIVDRKSITTSVITNVADGIELQYATRTIQYKDIMILTMKKSQLSQLAGDLSYAGIPVKAVGEDVSQKIPTFTLLSNVVKMLAHPEDNGHLYKVMISKPFLFRDEELARFKQLGGWINLYFDLTELTKENEENSDDLLLLTSIRDCFDKLKKMARLSKVLPSAALIERLAEVLGLQEKIIEDSMNVTEIGSYSSLLEQIRLKPIQNLWGLDAFMTELSNMIGTGLEEKIDIQGSDYDSVRIMNVHKSKGLEAPIIILAGSYSGSFPNPSLYIERSGDDIDTGIFKGHISLNSAPDKKYNKDRITSKHWQDVEEISAKKHIKEFDRLIYVAATRARNALIVFNSSSRTDPWVKLGTKINRGIDEIKDLKVSSQACEVDHEELTSNLIEEAKDICVKDIELWRSSIFNKDEATYKLITPSKSSGEELSFFSKTDDSVVCDYESIKIDIEHLEDIEEISSTFFGTSIHNLFEGVVEDKTNNEDLLIPLSSHYQDKIQMLEVFRQAMQKFVNSKLYSRLQEAKEVYCEVPFAFKKTDKESDIDEYINGTIDLVFKEHGSWKIIDYKTCNKHHDKNSLYKKYQGQLELYKEAWSMCTGEENIVAELFFVEK